MRMAFFERRISMKEKLEEISRKSKEKIAEIKDLLSVMGKRISMYQSWI